MKNSKSYRFLNMVANVLVVLVATVLIGFVAYQMFYEPTLRSIEARLLRAGDDFKGLEVVDFRKSRNTLLLATDVHCQYCVQALPFYQKLVNRSKEGANFQVIAVFNNKQEEIEQYLQQHKIDIEFLSDIDLPKLKVDVTPTVIWVDENRKIVGSFQGLLQENLEVAFFEEYGKVGVR